MNTTTIAQVPVGEHVEVIDLMLGARVRSGRFYKIVPDRIPDNVRPNHKRGRRLADGVEVDLANGVECVILTPEEVAQVTGK